MDLEPGPDPYPEGSSWDITKAEFTKAGKWDSLMRDLELQVSAALGAGVTVLGSGKASIAPVGTRFDDMSLDTHVWHSHIRADHASRSELYAWDPDREEEYIVLQAEWDNMSPKERAAAVLYSKSRGAPTAGSPVQPFYHSGKRRKR